MTRDYFLKPDDHCNRDARHAKNDAMPAQRGRLEDDSPFPFGIHKGKPMRDVPCEYLDWLRGQSWLPKWRQVADYIERSKNAINFELKKKGIE
jgi:hypothetical protein